MSTITLNNQVEIPRKGYGVFQITNQKECEESVRNALEIGYRLIDTAACYGNEAAVGRAIKASGVNRDELFIVSKVWIQDAGYEKTMLSFEKTLKNLQTDYLDLYLIHMPYGDYHGSWRAMEDLLKAGRIKAIGVCNFLADRLVDLILSHEIVPVVNQIELHPFSQRRDLRDVMAKYDVKPMAWAPFAEGKNNLFSHPVLTTIGNTYGKTAAQVTLRWLLQQDIIAIPKSIHKDRIYQNFTIDDFVLSEADMAKIAKLDTGEPLILDVDDLAETYRLHNITFEQ